MVCGDSIQKSPTCSLKDYAKRKYCSILCRNADPAFRERLKANGYKTASLGLNAGAFKKGNKPWNTGRTGYLSAEARRNISKSVSERIKNETPEKRAARMSKILENRIASGNWKPPRLGKRGAEVTGVWLDNEATYNAKHRWLQANWVKTGKCEQCGKHPRPFGNRKFGTEWANTDGQYDRNDRTTWKELCVSCHRRMDAR